MTAIAVQTSSPRPISDRQLRELRFRFHDPENLIQGLNRNRPDASRSIEVIGYYDETPVGGRKANPDAEFVWCCHCQKPTHWKGYVIRDNDGDVFIIGAQNCGKEHYGVDFDEAEAVFKNQRRRQATLDRWDLAVAKASALHSTLEALLHSEQLQALERLRNHMFKASKECSQLLARHAATATPMVVHHVERDFAAEQAREDKYDLAIRAFRLLAPDIRRERRDAGLVPQLDETPIYKRWTKDLGYLEGADFLIEDGDVRSAALALRQTIKEILGLEKQPTEGIPSNVFARQTRALADRASDLFRSCVRLSFYGLFFAEANVHRLVEWSKHHDQFSIESRPSGITVIPQFGKPAAIMMPLGVQLPPFEQFSSAATEIGLT